MTNMDRSIGAAVRLPACERKELAILALSRSATITELASEHGVSRKFIYAQTGKARVALDDAFMPVADENEMLFELAVSKTWLRQVIVALPLICHSSYRGVVEFMRDLLGVSIGVGTVCDELQAAARQAGIVNGAEDLSRVRVGLHDEIFQGKTPVLAGVDAASTYCYLLAAVEHRDADTWGVHLLDATERGLKPNHTIADAGQGLRAGQKAAWGDTPCHGDVFHVQHQYEGLANTLSHVAQGAASRRKKLEIMIDRAGQAGPDEGLAIELELARQTEVQAVRLARDVRMLTQWLSHDVLALAGPVLATRKTLFDFIVAELAQREAQDVRRIRPVRVALQNQRDDLLAFAGVLDGKLTAIARGHELSDSVVREACVLHRLPTTSAAYWQGWNQLRTALGAKFHILFDAVAFVMAQTPRSSSLVENLNSRLRNYFTLRRHLGGSYLDLLRFFLNHRRFMRSQRAERTGRSPRELLTGEGHPHWLKLLGLGAPQPQRT
jgi:hypothetical protein